MISTILPSSATFHAIQYNEKKVENGTAMLIDSKNVPSYLTGNSDLLQKHFIDYSARNDRIQNPQFHVAFSCKGREMSVDELKEYAYAWLAKMGYGHPDQPILMYFHRDTDNNHVHVVTSRVDPLGKKIDHNHERRKSQKVMSEIENRNSSLECDDAVAKAFGYKFGTLKQFQAILESMGYETYTEDDVCHIVRGGSEQGQIEINRITAHQQKVKLEDKRRRQLYAQLKKYRDMCSSKEELASMMKKKFGLSLVFFGDKDRPYGYVIIDHSDKAVYKGSEVFKIKDLLQFRSAEERLASVSETITSLLEGSYCTTKDVNRILKRQFGAYIRNYQLVLGERTFDIDEKLIDTLKENNKAAWLSSFYPKTETERAILCSLFGFSALEKVVVSPEHDRSDAEREVAKLFDEAAIRKNPNLLYESGAYRYYNVNGEWYAIGWEKKEIFNLTRMGLDVSRLEGKKQIQAKGNPFNRSSLSKKGSDYVERGHKRDWEIQDGGYDDYDSSMGINI